MPHRIVVGYDYKTRHVCTECLRGPAMKEGARAGAAMIWGDSGDTEDIVGEWALTVGLDRDEESGYDQSEFPKRVYEDQAHSDCTPTNKCVDRCAECGQPLGYSCPNSE